MVAQSHGEVQRRFARQEIVHLDNDTNTRGRAPDILIGNFDLYTHTYTEGLTVKLFDVIIYYATVLLYCSK